jgi:hypothetical protein
VPSSDVVNSSASTDVLEVELTPLWVGLVDRAGVARSGISSIITDAMVMAFWHDRAPLRCQLLSGLLDLLGAGKFKAPTGWD